MLCLNSKQSPTCRASSRLSEGSYVAPGAQFLSPP